MMFRVRTTVNLDEDVLQAARELARSRRSTLGEVLSELARRALQPAPDTTGTRNGVPLLPRREGSHPVTPETVQAILDEQ